MVLNSATIMLSTTIGFGNVHPRYLLIGGLFLSITIVQSFISPLLFSKLRSFPGPLAAKFSSFWLVSQCRLTRRSKAVMAEHQKHGDFVRIAPNHISINNPSAATEIYGHRTGFVKSEFYDAFHQVRPVVFNARDVSEHQRKRKYLNPAFSARALSEFETIMDDDIRKWKHRLLGMSRDNKCAVLDFTVWTNYLAFDVIGSFAFGRSFGFIDAGEDQYDLIRTIDMRGEVLNALGCLPLWIRPLMKYNYLDNFWSEGLRATANLGKIGHEAYMRRRAHPEPRKDLLSYLFTARESKKDQISEEEIIAESISFIVGGSDTTSSTITNCLDFIARDHTIQQKLAEEIEVTFPNALTDDWVPSNNVLSDLPYLNAVVREVMRVCPTSSTGLERITPRGGKIIAGKYIPGGTIVSVPTCGLMMDDRIFDNPHEFRPERWLGSDSGELIDYFLPFSTGPRACIGRNFAWMEMLKALVVVLKFFEIKRLATADTVIREGFFNKATECKVEMRRRK